MIANITQAVADLSTASTAANQLIATLNNVVERDIDPLFQGLGEAVAGANSAVLELNQLIENNEGAITSCTHTSLPEVSLLISDVRRLTNALTLLIARVEEDPSQIIFPSPKPIYDPQ